MTQFLSQYLGMANVSWQFVRSQSLRFALGFLSCAAAGCGSWAQHELTPVTGIVLLDGQPLQSGAIITMPERGRGAQASIDATGRFSLSTRDIGEGAVPGKHQVAVIATAGADLTAVDPEAKIKFTIPARYAQTDSSDLEIEVRPSQSNEVTLHLTSSQP